MKGPPRYLTFAWWNLHNFADYVNGRKADARWPKREEHYQAKRDRVLTALGEAFGRDYPDLLAVCEITRKAADDLLGRIPKGFDVHYAPTYKYDDGFQVAAFYREGIGLTPEVPLYPSEEEDLPDGARPMIPLHLTIPGHVIRFVACHWTALDVDSSEVARERLADVLRRNVHAFLKPAAPKLGVSRHVVVLGDLNEEPSSRIFENGLIGRRDRRSTHARHWRDESVRRIRLYNAAWRYFGEQVPHGTAAPANSGCAGTIFKDPHNWRTFDHVLVSDGLLGDETPYLDQSETRVVATPIMKDGNGLPRPFEPNSRCGVSDHLLIKGRLVLPETPP